MCGICGIVNFNDHLVDEMDLRVMMEKIKHRGPDDEGIFLDRNMGLGFVRLSILDLSPAGHQPMFSHDKRFVIVFNGEVYNYIEIREELKLKYEFKTGTDTEVVIAAYQEWGEKCLDRFNGMFAFVIYDIETKAVFGARDRFGVKPFYYFVDKDKFIFASEIKSILPMVDNLEADDRIIYDYLLTNRTGHTEDTFFKKIKKLQHGSILKISGDSLKFKKWYKLSEKIGENARLTAKEYRALFIDSLKLRLRADVPIGVSLSGGIDSSSITASLLKDFNLTELNTFSVVYGKEEPTDESEFIDEFKPLIKNMYYISPDADEFFKDIVRFIDAHNEPVPDIGPYAQFKVMELASKHVTVTLDGQGADEQLAGYHYFFGSYYIEIIRQFKFLKFFEENYEYLKKNRSAQALKYFLFYMLPISLQKKVSTYTYPSISKEFLKSDFQNNEVNEMLYKPKDLNESLMSHFEHKLEHLLNWDDLNSMCFSIESRVPFLDYRLVEATLSTPSDQKIFKGETKYILREALKDILPLKIVQRKDKKGFSNPRDKWFKSEKFQPFIYELINSESFSKRGYFDPKIANLQYGKHISGQIDASKEIWKWINLELWFRRFID